MTKHINISIGTEISGNGGIATVLSVLSEGGFFQKWNVIHLPTHTNSKRFFGLRRVYLLIRALIMLVYYHIFYKVGVVHVHMASRWSFRRKSLVVHLTNALRGRVILHLHGAEFLEFYSKECTPQKQKRIRAVFNTADKIIVLSTQWLEWVTGILDSPKKATVIYNAVPPLELSRKAVDSQLILFLGRLGQRKGVGDLLLAFAGLSKKYPGAKLALGGDGDVEFYKQQAKDLGIEEQVSFLGWVSGDVKMDWLCRAGVYVLPSYNEGFPMGVLEAMAAGVPVVASTAGGIPDAITHEHEGILVKAGDVDGIRLALERLVGDSKLGEKLAADAKEKFLSCFSSKAIFPQLDEIYRQLIHQQ